MLPAMGKCCCWKLVSPTTSWGGGRDSRETVALASRGFLCIVHACTEPDSNEAPANDPLSQGTDLVVAQAPMRKPFQRPIADLPAPFS